MVLQNSSDNTQGDSFGENSPASDDDPYSNSPTTAAQYSINGMNLAQPVPIIGPLLGFSQESFVKFFRARIQKHAEILKRPPTQTEAEAIAYHAAKQFSITSYGGPIGIVAGLWRANSTRATLRFPFWQPNLEQFHPELFINERFALLRGNRAVIMWHLLRSSAYAAFSKSIGDILFGSYGMSVAAVGEMGDTRLQDFKKAAELQTQQKRGGLPGPKMPGTVGSPQVGRMGQGNTPQVDDASPTAGMFQEESNEFGKDTFSTNDSSQRPEQSSASSNRWPQRPRQAPTTIPTQTQTQSQDDPFFTMDDASPTGGAGARADSPVQQPQQQGSAWDRVRRGAGRTPVGAPSGSGQAQQQNRGWAGVREQSQNSTGSDDAVFSSDGEDRNQDRSQAQREFDERVEKERRGGDFSTGNGDQKRW